MARKSTAALIFLVLLNGSVTVFDASGLSDDWGVDPELGGTDDIQQAIDNAKAGFSPASGFGQTLFSLFIAGANFVQGIFSALFSAPVMFMNLGVPAWFVTAFFAPWYIVGAFDFVYILTGRSI